MNLMKTLAKLKFLSSDQLNRLEGYDGKYSKAVIRRRLRRLRNEGYVLTTQPNKYEDAIHYLSQKGALYLCRQLGIDEIKTFKSNDKMKHAMAIAEVYVRLTELSRQNENFELLGFSNERMIRAGDTQLIPDILITYKINGNQKKAFVEVDLATEKVHAIYTSKMLQYDVINKVHKNLFPVIFITTSKDRAINIANKCSAISYTLKLTTFEKFDNLPYEFLQTV